MAYLSSDEIRKLLLDIMERFHNYCEANNLSYCLYGGTLLGAIRHKGFIPWDDDIDLIMPRPDYNRLKKYLAENPIEGLKIVDYETDKDYYLPFMKLVNTNTELTVTGTKDQKLGVFIDIFPMDGFTENSFVQRISMFKARVNFYLLYLWLDDKKKPTTVRQHVNEKILKPIVKRMNGKKFSKRIDKLTKRYNYDDGETIAMLTHTLLARRIYKKSDFFPVKKAEFEGLSLNIPKEWHKCLTNAYGDYMVLPPVEERVEKHRLNVKMKIEKDM